MSKSSVTTIGNYTADDLQRAMRVVIARYHLRMLRATRFEVYKGRRQYVAFDARPDGRCVPV